MRGAYSFLGLAFVVLLGGTWLLLRGTAEAPTELTARDTVIRNSSSPMAQLSLNSPAFADNTAMPSRFTCDGLNVSPPLSIENPPEGTRSLALIMEDPDIPAEVKQNSGIEMFDHWVLFNIAPTVNFIAEGEAPGVSGENSGGENGYTGACPPPQYEPTEHRYIFTLYALDTELALETGARKEEVQQAMEGHILTEATLTGTYDRSGGAE